jgi:hypothetical protein
VDNRLGMNIISVLNFQIHHVLNRDFRSHINLDTAPVEPFPLFWICVLQRWHLERAGRDAMDFYSAS